MSLAEGPLRSELRRAFPSGVASVQDLVKVGCRERTVYRRCLAGGPWQRILPGVVLLFTGQPTRGQEIRAAMLLCGADAMITGLEACSRHGIRRGPVTSRSREVHVLVPATRQVRAVGYVHVERTARLPGALLRGGIPLAPVPRACTDSVRRITDPGDVAELLADAVQRGLCTVAALSLELEEGSRRGTAVPRRVLADLGAGVRSAAERDAKKLWQTTGLPEPWWNASVYDHEGNLLGIVDCWFDDVAMAWEIESSEWHMTPADHDRTVARAAAFTAAGVVYTATKPRRIRSDGQTVAATLRATYAQALRRARPAVQARRAQ